MGAKLKRDRRPERLVKERIRVTYVIQFTIAAANKFELSALVKVKLLKYLR